MRDIIIYDSTLRDGAQAQGISFTVEDKLKILQKLDEMGIRYVEAGNPGSNPKDLEFFEKANHLALRHARVVAFGSTRRVGVKAEEDSNVKALLGAGTAVVAIFGKSWDFHVTHILKTTLEENLHMIQDTIRFLKAQGKEVVYDAEHFFDGYRANASYALQTLQAAFDAGADCLCLCDTNGGTFPDEIYSVTAQVVEKFQVTIGIHCHNDTGMAVANSVMAVRAGAVHVQGTMNGYGERCGNANLCTIIPNLQLKMGFGCIRKEAMQLLTPTSRYINEIANVVSDERAPYVGNCAFAHKAGMHADAVNKDPLAYEHIDPEETGNHRSFLMSEVAGRGAVLQLINTIDPSISKDSPKTNEILGKLKEMEYEGYQYEGAEGSFKLVIRRVLGMYRPFFELGEFKVIINEPTINSVNSSAMVKIKVGEQQEITAAEGDGPVNALDSAVRRALEHFYPQLKEMKLTDYKVRVLDSTSATAAKVRVLIESTDGIEKWTTIGVSTDIIDASWKALVDSIEYKLLKTASN